jgi:hypothetical protein
MSYPTVSLYRVGSAAGVAPPPVARGPLPPFDTPIPSPDHPWPVIPVYTTLPTNQVIPEGPDPLWWRGNVFGIAMPNMPMISGMEGSPNLHVLTWFLDRYPPDFRADFLQVYAERGYTHFSLSWPDSRVFGTSEDQFVDLCVSVLEAGIPYVHVKLLSKYYDPCDALWPEVSGGITSIMRKLIDAEAVQHVSNWEMNLIWQHRPENQQSVIDGIAGICAAAPYPIHQWFHGSPHYASWGPNPHDRFEWWPKQRGKLAGVLFQGHGWAREYPCLPPGQTAEHWPAGDMQARAVDTLRQFARGDQQNVDGPFRFVYWEDCATQMFTDAACTEDIGDLRGWESICAQLPGTACVPISGFGNGCRYPDGRPTLGQW